MPRSLHRLGVLLLAILPLSMSAADFRAGAAAVDITPTEFPVIVNGGFLEKQATKANDALHARALVLDDGATRIALCVVDTCVMMRELIDEAKALASKTTGIPTERMLVSATHTHSAPSVMACLGTRLDPKYAAWLPGKIAEAIAAAAGKLTPARVGWGVAPAGEFTNCRRWIRRPDKMLTDPFGVVSARAHMHPGYQSPDAIGPSGPIDPDLSLLSVQTAAGKPLALLANFSMHYFGATPVSADYFGKFASGIGAQIGAEAEFVGIMSQGTSGDSHWMDYSQPKRDITSEQYAAGLMKIAAEAYRKIEHCDSAPMAMAETTLKLRRRVADAARLEWARKLAESMGDRVAKNQPEVYAREQLLLAAEPERELKLQALRIGGLGITAIPNEVYAITGLKLKAWSPLRPTMNIELANGSEGYIPPPEQHVLGGYTTWAARTAGLVPEAEPRIVETVLGLLEKVSGEKRRAIVEEHGAYPKAVLAAKPLAYWRMNEIVPPTAHDATGHGHHARYEWERGVAFHLPGAGSDFSGPEQINRAAHFAGGSMKAALPKLGADSTVTFWMWNGLDPQARATTGVAFARGKERLGITGTSGEPGRLFFDDGAGTATLLGPSTLGLREWHHVALVRRGREVAVYLDGKAEVAGEASAAATAGEFIFGDTFEGKLDEVAVFDRALAAEEVVTQASGLSGAGGAQARDLPHDPPPLPPDESLRRIHVPAGWKAELVASEPDVLDPVAFDWDERGRLWIIEMADYPLGMDNAGQPGGRIRVLTDTDDDGRYDRSALFADGLRFPNGVLTWRDGAIVTAAPEILFLRDTDGDGRADEREVLVSGLQEGNQQLRANGLRWGLDGWVYVAAGGHHGKYGVDTKLRSHRAGEEVLVGSRDFRFRPDGGRLEPASGPTQFGRNRDDWGRWFGTQNSNPLWHYVLPDHYLRRNPHFGAAETRVQLLTPQNPPVFPASALEKRFHSFDQSGHFTSACSGVIVRDARVFPAGELHAFVCEPFHNLIQHARLAESGVTFAAQRVPGEKQLDFFASEDRWCRPVMLREGPDGALWVADMYRYMIEHPQFLPAAGKEELLPHYRAGDDRGRIYRVSREGAPAFRPVRFDRMSAVELVAALDSPSGWVRDKAQQILLWRDDSAAVAPLRAATTTSSNPLARLHALWTLHGLSELQDADIARALDDTHPGVRENALRLGESRRLPMLDAAARLVDDPDPKVRLQLAFSLGSAEAGPGGRTLARLLEAHGDNPMMLAAVMSSATPHIVELARRATPESRDGARLGFGKPSYEPLLQTALGLDDRTALALLLKPMLTPGDRAHSGEQVSAFARLLDVLARSHRSLDTLRAGDDALTALLAKADAIFTQARAAATDADASTTDRIAGAALLARLPASRTEAIALLTAWLDPRHPADAQAAALRALGESGAPEVPPALAAAWPAFGPATRQAALAVWMTREPWAFDLAQRVQRAELPVSALDASQRARLLKHEAARVRQLAAKLFAAGATARGKVVAAYRPALSLKGDAAKGRDAFLRACAVCHRRGPDGKDIGPDLISVVEHPPEKLLASILDPNADIQPGFAAYTCTLRSGEQIYGLVAAETANSVTMKLPDATARTILRTEIATLQSQHTSLMPDGLEAALPPQDMADLIAFLKGAAHGR